MSFIVDYLDKPYEERDHDSFPSRWEIYEQYLKSIVGKIPLEAYEFATADWHLSSGDSRSLHDAELIELSLQGGFTSVRFRKMVRRPSQHLYARMHFSRIAYSHAMFSRHGFLDKRRRRHHLDIVMRLLGPQYDGHIEIRYSKVHSYSFTSPRFSGPAFPGDLLLDEVRISDSGLVIHEIRFDGDVRYSIECVNIYYKWQPLDQASALAHRN